MPYKRKDSPIWWVSYTDASGRRVRRSTGTTDRKEAVGLEAKWKLAAHEEQHWGREPDRSIEEVMLAFLQAKRDKRSHSDDKLHAKRWRQLLPDRSIQSLKRSDISGYIATRKEMGVSNSTINRELAFLAACISFCNHAFEWQLPNPITGQKLKEPEGRVRYLTEDEAVALVAAAESEPKAPHLADFIRLGLNTGMRRGEMLGLEWSRVDMKRGLILLEGRHTKTGKRRTVPLNEHAQAALNGRRRFCSENCPSSHWVFCDRSGKRLACVKGSFGTACRRAGITDFHVHDLRHTCAAWLVSAGVPLPEVRDLLGHSTVAMTERYAHLRPDNVRAAVGRLDEMSRFRHGGDERTVENIS
ncbi:tyrosine-type recombinase/integrase [Methylotetracoccus oryzae]|uniref:tyrosine-type recombinase/integrase n=1 Tax=Methylotetracoccus oryzae TaxID=1919059 RepID=UPI00111B39CB|nr:site-specific integrase [Methylotetracoccus oryzae]